MRRDSSFDSAERFSVVGNGDSQCGLRRGIVGTENYDVFRAQLILQAACLRVRYMNQSMPEPTTRNQVGLSQGINGRVRVRADESTGAQFDPAKVPHDDGAEIGEIRDGLITTVRAVRKNRLQHRNACGSGRFAVVGGTLYLAIRTDHESETNVPGVVVTLPESFDKASRFILGLNSSNMPNEFALLNLENRLDGSRVTRNGVFAGTGFLAIGHRTSLGGDVV